MAVLCEETDCGNTWSPNVILPREFHPFYITGTYAFVHIRSQSSAVFSVKQGGPGVMVPKGVCPRCKADVYHSCQPLVLILGKAPLPAGTQGRNSAVFRRWSRSRSPITITQLTRTACSQVFGITSLVLIFIF